MYLIFQIEKIPDNISLTDSASIPYAALTAWSAITVSGGIVPNQAHRMRVLVLGASGGVGTMLVQILASWGAEVAAVCSSDAFDLVSNLGAIEFYDYKDPETKELLTSYPGFDLIVDASGNNDSTYIKGLKEWRGASYVSLTPPLLKNIDNLGFITGSIKSLTEIIVDNAQSLSDGKFKKWAFYMPNPWALNDITKMIENNRLVAVVDKVFPFKDGHEAYKHILNGPIRGKTIINHV